MPAENEILSYFEMCQREGTSLQRGMNFRLAVNSEFGDEFAIVGPTMARMSGHFWDGFHR